MLPKTTQNTKPLAGFCWRVCLPIAFVRAILSCPSPECRIKHAGSIYIGSVFQAPIICVGDRAHAFGTMRLPPRILPALTNVRSAEDCSPSLRHDGLWFFC